jgi:2-dehydro-3-deoxyglucarate aldolase/4-hydroxy-2-oxoheptanedioate aldolase
MLLPNSVKQALKAGKVQYGCNLGQIRSQDVVKIVAQAGFHWSFVDMEHGGYALETVQDICRIAQTVNFAPIVRVPELHYSHVARALDVGAAGIMFPRVESPELLRDAVSWTRFPPMGTRGFGLTPFHFEHRPLTMVQQMEEINANTIVALQIETKRAFEAREELLSVGNIDAVMVGPSDLSISLGVPGEYEHPKMVETIEAIRDTCNAKGIAPGIHVRSTKLARFWKERGMRFLSCSSETAMLFERAKEIISTIES